MQQRTHSPKTTMMVVTEQCSRSWSSRRALRFDSGPGTRPAFLSLRLSHRTPHTVSLLNAPPFFPFSDSMRGAHRSCHLRSMFSLWTGLTLVFLCCLQAVRAAQWLGERALPELSYGQIRTLATSVDPTKNLDPSDRHSHLSKILIPRPGM